ncbi:MAG: tRNA pseudouridine(55) synthase TruB [Desulfobulbaceae bacterium]|nr:tRNA pseudouridine(55) synthase TruB [Desulfobulbaceae bacterium]
MGKRQPVQVDGQDFSARVFLVDKPQGKTSFALVRRIRWLLGIKKVGHAGTLDPFATGLLIVCAGRPATRHIEQFMVGRKEYSARLKLGVETETLDPEGKVIRESRVPQLGKEEIISCLQSFVGEQMQAPPPFSAVKYKGKPLYFYARKGIVIRKEPRPIEIYRLDFTGYDPLSSCLDIRVTCSRGTYIRVLAADIGLSFGCGAHLVELRRTKIGGLSVNNSLSGEALLQEDGLRHLLAGMMSVEEAIKRVYCLPGRPSGPDHEAT